MLLIMKAYEINYHLARNGVTKREIASSLGVTLQAVSGVVNDKSISHRIARAIADAIGMPLGDVFEKYANGNKVKTRGKNNDN